MAVTCHTINKFQIIMQFIATLLLSFLLFNCTAQGIVPFQSDTLWGYKSSNGLVIIEPQYQYATKFFENIAIVAIDNKFGAIDRKNKIIIPINYDFLRPIDSVDFLFGTRAKYFGEYLMGVITRDEKIKIPAEYSHISKQGNTYSVTKNTDSIIEKSDLGDIRSIKSVYGLLDSNGSTLIPCKFNNISWLNDTLLMVDSSTPSPDGKFLIPNNALFNINGKQLTEFKYMVFGQFTEGLAKARIGNKFGFIYPNGEVAIPISFDYCEDFKNGYAMIEQKDKWGAIDKSGKVIIEPKYDYQFVKATLKEKYGW